MLKIGDIFEHEYSYTQAQVSLYAEVSGDTNPLHTNEETGKASIFGRCIMHGFLGASVFTKIFGSLWYADGHIYMKQSMMWMKPMFADEKYKAVITVKEIFSEKNRVLYECAVFDIKSGDQTISGEAMLMNKKKYVW
jgi:3-hydroxybutyryl-CoA dehydratase